MAVTDPPPRTEPRELGPIRPPNEAYSLLLRITRNCPWNRCTFCPIYKGATFGVRPLDEIKRDIDTAKRTADYIAGIARATGTSVGEAAVMFANTTDNDADRNVALWLHGGGRTVFLQDANSLVMKTPDLIEALNYLKTSFPDTDRITSYARSQTAARKTVEELKALREAGLSRLHIGLESGYDPVLAFLHKGVTAAEHIAGGKNVVASGISLSEYVMLGAGGKTMLGEHARATADVLNEINPDFIRFRTLTIQPRMEISADVRSGAFIRATDEEIVEEERLILERLTVHSTVTSDHMINLLPEVEGTLPEDKQTMLDIIARFQSLPPEERDMYKLGRRLGAFSRLEHLDSAIRREKVEEIMKQLHGRGESPLDDVLFNLMERYV